MKKIDYLLATEKELKKYGVEDTNEIMNQVKDLMEILDIENIEEELGNPTEYVLKLLDYNGITPKEVHREHKTIKEKISNSNYTNKEDVVDIIVTMGKEHYKLDRCKKINLTVTSGRVFLDLSEVKNDIDIVINAHFSEINLELLDSTYIIDNTSILLGTNIFDGDNNIKMKTGNKITIEGRLVASAINTLEAR